MNHESLRLDKIVSPAVLLCLLCIHVCTTEISAHSSGGDCDYSCTMNVFIAFHFTCRQLDNLLWNFFRFHNFYFNRCYFSSFNRNFANLFRSVLSYYTPVELMSSMPVIILLLMPLVVLSSSLTITIYVNLDLTIWWSVPREKDF